MRIFYTAKYEYDNESIACLLAHHTQSSAFEHLDFSHTFIDLSCNYTRWVICASLRSRRRRRQRRHRGNVVVIDTRCSKSALLLLAFDTYVQLNICCADDSSFGNCFGWILARVWHIVARRSGFWSICSKLHNVGCETGIRKFFLHFVYFPKWIDVVTLPHELHRKPSNKSETDVRLQQIYRSIRSHKQVITSFLSPNAWMKVYRAANIEQIIHNTFTGKFPAGCECVCHSQI